MNETPNSTTKANRLIDEMLAAQSRFSAAWCDDAPLTEQQRRDEARRDEARSLILAMLKSEKRAGWHAAIHWLQERSSSHAGRWMTMDPREALKDAAREMETINGI